MYISQFYISIFLCLTLTSIFAQDVPDPAKQPQHWKNLFNFGFNINQAAFSDNWQGGGINSFAFSTNLTAKFDYSKDRVSFISSVDALYSMLKNDGQSVRKSNDKLLVDSKLGYSFNTKWDISLGFNFLSQFAAGYNYVTDAAGVEQELLISNLFAPAFITLSLGLTYEPKDYFSVQIAPFSPRFTIVNDTSIINNVPNNYGVEQGQISRTEWAAGQIIADFNKDILKDINLKFRYQLFINYEDLDISKVDHRLDLSLTARINKYITTSFGLIVIYDADQHEDAQFNQFLGIGFLYQYNNN